MQERPQNHSSKLLKLDALRLGGELAMGHCVEGSGKDRVAKERLFGLLTCGNVYEALCRKARREANGSNRNGLEELV